MKRKIKVNDNPHFEVCKSIRRGVGIMGTRKMKDVRKELSKKACRGNV